MLAFSGSRIDPLELESCNSDEPEPPTGSKVTRQIPREPTVRDFGAQEICFSVTCGVCVLVVVAAVMVNMACFLTEPKVAVRTTQPVAADLVVVTGNPRLADPWGTVTVAGTVTPVLLLPTVTAMLPAGFERTTTQVVPVPADTLVGLQLKEDIVGVDQSVKVAVCEDVPRLALTVPLLSAVIVPIVALKAIEVFPALITTLAGTVISVDVELNVIVVFATGACDRVTVQLLVAPDMTPVGLHTRELTSIGAVREIVTDCEEPL